MMVRMEMIMMTTVTRVLLVVFLEKRMRSMSMRKVIIKMALNAIIIKTMIVLLTMMIIITTVVVVMKKMMMSKKKRMEEEEEG